MPSSTSPAVQNERGLSMVMNLIELGHKDVLGFDFIDHLLGAFSDLADL